MAHYDQLINISFTAGDGCSNDERFAELIGTALGTDVYNYAVSGTGTDQPSPAITGNSSSSSPTDRPAGPVKHRRSMWSRASCRLMAGRRLGTTQACVPMGRWAYRVSVASRRSRQEPNIIAAKLLVSPP